MARNLPKSNPEEEADFRVLLEIGSHPILRHYKATRPVLFQVRHRYGDCEHKYVRAVSRDDIRPMCLVCKVVCPWRERSPYMARPEGERILITPAQIVRGDIFDDAGWGNKYLGMLVMKVTPQPDGRVIIKMHRDGREMENLAIHPYDLVWIKPNG